MSLAYELQYAAVLYASTAALGTYIFRPVALELNILLLPVGGVLDVQYILVSFEQPTNAPLPIEVTLFGMVIEVRLEQSQNAKLPIEVTLSGMVYSVSPAGANALRELLTIRHLLSVDANLPLNSLRLEQSQNA